MLVINHTFKGRVKSFILFFYHKMPYTAKLWSSLPQNIIKYKSIKVKKGYIYEGRGFLLRNLFIILKEVSMLLKFTSI